MKADIRNLQVKIGWQTAEGMVAGTGHITLLAGVLIITKEPASQEEIEIAGCYVTRQPELLYVDPAPEPFVPPPAPSMWKRLKNWMRPEKGYTTNPRKIQKKMDELFGKK
jgi:hypothetical protein